MSDLKLQLGRRIRDFRAIKKLSQDKLAEKIGISGKYLGEVERGEANVSLEKLELIAGALGVTIGQLLDNAHKNDTGILKDEISVMVRKANVTQTELIYRIIKDILEVVKQKSSKGFQ